MTTYLNLGRLTTEANSAEILATLSPIMVTPNAQTSTSSYVIVSGSTIDTAQANHLVSIHYRIRETGGTNGITVKVQGSMDGTNFTDITAQDNTGTAQSGVDVAVSASSAATLFCTGATASWRYYRVMVKDTVASSHGQATVIGFAK